MPSKYKKKQKAAMRRIEERDTPPPPPIPPSAHSDAEDDARACKDGAPGDTSKDPTESPLTSLTESGSNRATAGSGSAPTGPLSGTRTVMAELADAFQSTSLRVQDLEEQALTAIHAHEQSAVNLKSICDQLSMAREQLTFNVEGAIASTPKHEQLLRELATPSPVNLDRMNVTAESVVMYQSNHATEAEEPTAATTVLPVMGLRDTDSDDKEIAKTIKLDRSRRNLFRPRGELEMDEKYEERTEHQKRWVACEVLAVRSAEWVATAIPDATYAPPHYGNVATGGGAPDPGSDPSTMNSSYNTPTAGSNKTIPRSRRTSATNTNEFPTESLYQALLHHPRPNYGTVVAQDQGTQPIVIQPVKQSVTYGGPNTQYANVPPIMTPTVEQTYRNVPVAHASGTCRSAPPPRAANTLRPPTMYHSAVRDTRGTNTVPARQPPASIRSESAPYARDALYYEDDEDDPFSYPGDEKDANTRYLTEQILYIQDLVGEALRVPPPDAPGMKNWKGISVTVKYGGQDDAKLFVRFVKDLLRVLFLNRTLDESAAEYHVPLLGQYLEEDARDWFDRTINDIRATNYGCTLEQALCLMFKRFVHRSPAIQAVAEFDRLRYDRRRGVEAMYEEMMQLSHEMPCLPDKYTFSHKLMNKLPREMSDALVRHYNVHVGVSSLAEIKRAAVQEENKMIAISEHQRERWPRENARDDARARGHTTPQYGRYQGYKEAHATRRASIEHNRGTNPTTAMMHPRNHGTSPGKGTASGQVDTGGRTNPVNSAGTHKPDYGVNRNRDEQKPAYGTKLDGARSGNCHTCGKPGHWSKDCPQKSRPRLQAARVGDEDQADEDPQDRNNQGARSCSPSPAVHGYQDDYDAQDTDNESNHSSFVRVPSEGSGSDDAPWSPEDEYAEAEQWGGSQYDSERSDDSSPRFAGMRLYSLRDTAEGPKEEHETPRPEEDAPRVFGRVDYADDVIWHTSAGIVAQRRRIDGTNMPPTFTEARAANTATPGESEDEAMSEDSEGPPPLEDLPTRDNVGMTVISEPSPMPLQVNFQLPDGAYAPEHYSA
ncbi:uncharacterized protein BXZ73DRAFT_83567 [Epithele typhae]|uniref:uncharacterized protein n=1 Tax=Epithele typhae TaxID=378194 RepID=UPI002008076D|nr:uncharacterized protein BXZ73DRAFT_83567 [Epithele typhae]KAH9910440.1 hypothetical protein BXZ73DRAFT_83567 [Epithele typhae]